MTNRLQIAWLTSGRGPGSYGALEFLLKAIDDGLTVDIAVVFVNRAAGEAEPTDRLMDMVRGRGIALETLSSVAFRRGQGGKRAEQGEPLPAWRGEYDKEVVRLLGRHTFDFGVMFGYMLIATEALYGAYTFLNDHPALPGGPVGTYQEVIAELIRRRAPESGCLMNIVTGDLDRGPVVSYCRFPIWDASNQILWRWDYPPDQLVAGTRENLPLFHDIRARGVARERPFLVETLRALTEDELQIPPANPLDLTAKVEAAMLKGAREAASR